MSRVRNKITLMVATLFVATLAGLFAFSPAAARWAYAQTVPTITPTSPPTQEATAPSVPTATAEATTPVQQPTATRPPLGQATATPRPTTGASGATATPTALLSAAEAEWPTAEACSLEPTARVLDGGAWVYEGPGDDYEPIGRLEEDTVRPLLARAEYGRWWLVALDEDEHAWIADTDVEVQGDTGELPLAEAPALPDGQTPTPGPTWEPTPDRDCITPTATATPTEESTSTPVPTASPTLTATAEPEPPSATPESSATDELEPLPAEEEEGNSLMWLPVAGLVLLAAAAFLFVTRRS
jgi:hypothetical protein